MHAGVCSGCAGGCCLPELPLEFPDGTTPVVSRVILHLGDLPPTPGSDSAGAARGTSGGPNLRPGLGPGKEGSSSLQRSLAPLPPLLLPHGGLYMEKVHVRLGSSIYFTSAQQEVAFGASPQDVWSELGRPCSIVHREVRPCSGASNNTDTTLHTDAHSASMLNAHTTLSTHPHTTLLRCEHLLLTPHKYSHYTH